MPWWVTLPLHCGGLIWKEDGFTSMELVSALSRSTFFLLSLMALGYLSRRYGVLREGEERVLSDFVFHISLPSLVIWGLSSMRMSDRVLKMVLGVSAPMILVAALIYLVGRLLGLDRDRIVLLITTSVSGNTGFYGIPYVRAVFPQGGTGLAVLAWASTLVTFTFLVVPLFEAARRKGNLVRRTAKNPLIWAALVGLLLMISGAEVPEFVSYTLKELGDTSGPVAMFMLGAFFYGRRGLSFDPAPFLGKVLLLPTIALSLSYLVGLSRLEASITTLMSAMPVAVALAVLSDVYDFHREEVYSLVLVTSLLSPIYLGAWLAMLSWR